MAAPYYGKKIKDQLEAISYYILDTLYLSVCFSNAVMKGPFALDKEYANWDDKGDYDPIVKTIPRAEYNGMIFIPI